MEEFIKIQFDSKALIIMIIIPIVIAVFSTVKMVNTLATVSKYEKVQGTVVDVEQRNISSAEKSVTTNFIKYNYKMNGKTYQTESKSGMFVSKKLEIAENFMLIPKNLQKLFSHKT